MYDFYHLPHNSVRQYRSSALRYQAVGRSLDDRITIIKGIIYRITRTDDNGLQRGTTPECSFSYRSDTVWNNDGLQRGTMTECLVSYPSDTIRNNYTAGSVLRTLNENAAHYCQVFIYLSGYKLVSIYELKIVKFYHPTFQMLWNYIRVSRHLQLQSLQWQSICVLVALSNVSAYMITSFPEAVLMISIPATILVNLWIMFCLRNLFQHKDDGMMRNHLAYLIKINNFVHNKAYSS